MRIFSPTVQDGFEWIVPVSERDFEMFGRLNAKIWAPRWRPVQMKLIRGDDYSRRSDFPWFGDDLLILRPRAVDALASRLEGVGELLPLDVEGDELYALNVIQEVDALDEAGSEILRSDDGSVMWVDRYVMRPEALHDPFVFKLPQLNPSPIFVDEAFVECVERAGLVGIKFATVWADSYE